MLMHTRYSRARTPTLGGDHTRLPRGETISTPMSRVSQGTVPIRKQFLPKVRRAQVQRPRAALTLDDLARAGEAIVRTALAAARPFGADKPPIP